MTMFGDNFGGGFSGGGYGGGYDYAGGCSYQPVYAPVQHYHDEHFSQPCYDDSFNDPEPIPVPELEQPLYDSYDVYDAQADIPLPAEPAVDPLAHNATTASHRLSASSGAEAQALMERVVNEAIAEQERHMAIEAAEIAAAAAAESEAAASRGFLAKLGGFFGIAR